MVDADSGEPESVSQESVSTALESLNRSASGVARNALVSYASLFVSSAAGVVLTPLIFHGIGADAFGVWSLALSAVAYTGLVELGISTATTKRVAELEHEGAERLRVLLRTALVLHLVAGACCAALCLALVWAFPLMFDLGATGVTTARATVALVAVWQVLTVISNVFVAALFGTGRLYLSTRTGFVVSLGLSVAQATLASLGAGIEFLGMALAVSSVLQVWILIHQTRNHLSGVFIRGVRYDRMEARLLLSSSWRISVNYVAGTIAFGADVVVVGLLLSAREAAAFALAQKGAVLARQLLEKLVGGLVPTYAGSSTDSAFLARLYRDAVIYSGLLALPMGAVMALLGKPLLHAWLGATPEGTVPVLALLGILLVAAVPGMNAAYALLGTGKAGLLAKVTVIGAIINLPASLLLTKGLGVVGPVLGSLVAVLIIDFVYLPLLVCRSLGVSPSGFAREVLTALSAPALTAASIALIFRSIGGGPYVAFPGALSTVVLSLLAWRAVGATESDKARISVVAAAMKLRTTRVSVDQH